MRLKVGVPPSRAEPASTGGELAASPRMGWLLAVCCVAQFMVILDLSIVNVALPSIQLGLGFSSVDLQWVVDAYAIAFAGFLMIGGRAADQFGQRRTFVLALLLFALASLVGGSAADKEMLIAARAAQGLAGALMAASALAIITSSFPPGPKLHRAIALWAAMNGAGGAAGTLFGGILTQELGWRWVLLINPPIGVAAAVVGWAVVTERRRTEGSPSFDLAGALTLTGGQMVLVYGIVEAGLLGWSVPRAYVPVLVGIATLVAFAYIEARVASAPLVPFKELTRPLNVANTIVLLFSAALFPMWYVSSLYLQQVLGLSPLHTGLTFLPMTFVIMLCASNAGKLVSRFGTRSVLGSGLVMMTAGLLLFARIRAGGSPVTEILLPGLLTAAGIALSIVPSTIAATQGAKKGQAGLVSGLVNTSRQVGGGLGIAVLITLATTRTSGLIGLGHAVPAALTDGFRLAYWIGAGLAATAAVLTFVLIPRTVTEQSRRRLRPALVVSGVVACFVALNLATASSGGAPIGAYSDNDTYNFVSAPDLHPPVVQAEYEAPSKQLAPGYILLANFYDLSHPPMRGQSGPIILDKHLQLVWFHPVPKNVLASDLAVQSYHGQKVLTWWQGVVTNSGQTLRGEDVVVNKHYKAIARLHGAKGWILTLHDFVIHGNDAWVTANKNLPMNLSRFGGAYNGAVIDSAVQEYNLVTGKLIRTWDALRHIPLGDSYASVPTNGFPWDAYHVNALQLTGHGSVLVSMRNTWAAYLVNMRTGRVVWTLGGKHSSFKFEKGSDFSWQHDVRMHRGSTVSLFDDHCCQITGGGTYVSPTGVSRGLVLRLNKRAHTVTLGAEYGRTAGRDADYMGSLELLPNGNAFVGWGARPYFSEYSPHGKLLLDGKLPYPDLTYRATVASWVGLPLGPPDGAARRVEGRVTVFASWNGATRVTAWRVLAGPSASALHVVQASAKTGFETPLPVARAYRFFKVQALNAAHRVIGTSRAFRLSS